MGFPRQEYWNGLPFPSPGDLLDPGIEPRSTALAGGFPGHWCHPGSPYTIVRGQKRKKLKRKRDLTQIFIKALDVNMKNLVFMPQTAIFIMVVLDSEGLELIFQITFLLLLLSRFSPVRLCVTQIGRAHV